MQQQLLKCKNCGAPLEAAETQERIVCIYCGTPNVFSLSASETMKKAVEVRRANKDELNQLEDAYNEALQRQDYEGFLANYRAYLTLYMRGTPGFEDEEVLEQYVDEQIERYQRSFAKQGVMAAQAQEKAKEMTEQAEQQVQSAATTTASAPAPPRRRKALWGTGGGMLIVILGIVGYLFAGRVVHLPTNTRYLNALDPSNIGYVAITLAVLGGGWLVRYLRRR